MKKKPQVGDRIKTLRGAMSQAEFADLLGVQQATVSAWEVGENPPSSEAWMKLGMWAPYPENIWCWQQGGLDVETMLSAADKTLKERGAPPKPGEVHRVSRFRQTEQGREEAGPPLILAGEFIPNPLSTICFVLDEKSASFPVKPGDIAVVDTSHAGAQDLVLSPFFNTVVLMEFKRESTPSHLPTGLFVGQLLSRQGPPPFTWYAELAVLNERLEVHRFTVGRWEAESPIVRRPDPTSHTGWVKTDAENFALEEIRLYPGCEIVGLVIGWLAKPTVKNV